MLLSPAMKAVLFFAIFWAYQDGVNHAVKSHSFASFYRVEQGKKTERIDISWLPIGGEPSLLEIAAGKNFSLEETLQIARRIGSPVTRFGPYPASAALWKKAGAQGKRLRSGRVRYKMLDRAMRPEAVNCLHALTDIAGFLETGTLRGRSGTQEAVRHFWAHGLLSSVVPVDPERYGLLPKGSGL
jgi:hypothetical protein